MIHLKDSGYIIKRKNLFDSDKYITIFTKEHGKVELLAKGVRRINSRRSPHLELLNLVRFHAIKTRTNFILTDIDVINTYSEMKEEYANLGIFFLFCELIDKLCPENVKHSDIYELLDNTVYKLTDGDKSKIVFDFQVNLLTMLGFWDPSKTFKNEWEIDRFIEDVVEKKIKSKLFLKL